MKSISTIVLIICCIFKSYAQEISFPQYVSHLADNPFLISPSYAGIGTGLQIRLNGVSQWIGVKEAPDTQSLTVESRIAETFGGGVTIFNDKNGFTSQKGVRSSLAKHLTLSHFHNSFLSFALSYSFTQFSINTSYNSTTQSVPNRTLTSSNFDFGMLYRYERFSMSANVVNLLDRKIEDFESGEPKVLRQYNIFSSYVFTRISRKIQLEPSVFIEYREFDQRSRTDVNVKARRGVSDGYVWTGLSYTFLNDQLFNPNSIAPLFGFKKGFFYASYGFSVNLNETQNFNYGTHMITLGFDYEKRPSLARCTQKMIIF